MASQKEIETATEGWDSDPLVVVSKRIRNFAFPLSVLLGTAKDEDRAAWKAPTSRAADRDEHVLTLFAGVTFLGTATTAWAYRGLADPSKSRDQKGRPIPPNAGDCVLLYPSSNVPSNIFEQDPFLDPLTRAIKPSEVQKAWVRVLEYWQDVDKDVTQRGRVGLWTPPGGYDSAELVILKMSELLGQTSQKGRLAYAAAQKAIKICRDSGHLGALHDYAVRDPQGSTIFEEARVRSRAFRPTDL
jgi:hypothetical protein